MIVMKHTNINSGGAKMPTEPETEAEAAERQRRFNPTTYESVNHPVNDPLHPDPAQRQRATGQHETDAKRAERIGMSSLRMTDDASRQVQKTPHRVSLDSIIARIEHIDYINPERHPHMTIALLTVSNGYIIVGKSVPADPQNFDPDLGKKFAYEDGIRQLWPLEAYLLREKLMLGLGDDERTQEEN